MFGAIKVIFEILGIIAYIIFWIAVCESIENKDNRCASYLFAIVHWTALITLFIYIWVEM